MKSITQLAAKFAFQSYFDDALLRYAILAQTNGNPIVDSTVQYAQSPGVGVMLHPASQSPIAVQFKGGEADSAVVHLVPGQKILTGRFEQFAWGLPFGWLGGGNVVLYVFHTDKADVVFPDAAAPVIVHRQRIAVQNAAVAAPSIPNWPLAFPWGNANRSVGGNLTPQKAAPLVPITADVAMLEYRAALAGPLDLIVQFTNTDEFDLDSAGAVTNGVHYFPITIPAVNGVAAPVWLPPEIAGLGGDSCAVDIFDPAGGVGGQFVDVVRYGRFM